MGWSNVKETKAARKLPKYFDELKEDFLNCIVTKVQDHMIPKSLIINWDQTGVKMVPCSEWTMAEKESKQVSVTGPGDKRQITAVLGCSLDGSILPPQLLYQGKSEQCHPNHKFPDDWHVHHSESHWSTSQTMMR